MTFTKNVLWLFPALLATGLGCSKPLTTDEACTTSAKIGCDNLVRCRGMFGLLRDHGTMEQCLAVNKKTCVESVSRPKTGNTPDLEEKCALARKAITCQVYLDGTAVVGCETRPGPLKTDEVCISSNQCGGQTNSCLIVGSNLCGRCVSRVNAGGDCSMGKPCITGHSCVTTTDMATMVATSVCVKRVAKDGVCNAANPCDSGLLCVGFMAASMSMGTPAVDGKCTPPVRKKDGVCDGRNRGAPNCDGGLGLYCSNAAALATDMTMLMGTCLERKLAKEGQPCGTVGTESIECEAGSKLSCTRPYANNPMNPTMRTPDGVCKVRSAAGAACGALSPSCIPNHTCEGQDDMLMVAGKCQPRDFLLCNSRMTPGGAGGAGGSGAGGAGGARP